MPRSYGPRRFHRVTRYRRTRTLSNRNVFGRRSSYSQAVQIAALRRRINKVYRAAKPERKVYVESDASQYALDSSVSGHNNYSLAALNIQNGSGDQNRIGDKVFRKDTYYLTFEYYNNSQTGYHDSESSGTSIRVICGGWKNAETNSTVPSLQTVITNYTSTGAPSTISAVAPLTKGVTETQDIYKDFTFNITTERNQKVLKVSTPWYSCRYDPNGNTSNHSWIWIVANGLHWDANFTETVQLTALKKTVFTDA